MITTADAQQIISAHAFDLGVEPVPFEQALGRILREDIVADRDFPPYDRVAMDGIAIRYQEYQKGIRTFDIEGIAAAGVPKKSWDKPNACLEIMTGAIMPEGLDTVIPYEQVHIQDQKATLMAEHNPVKAQQNIHFQGQDRKKGDVLIRPGRKLAAPEMGVCATVGKTMLQVSQRPKALILSSGDELVDMAQKPKAHQIRKSNVHRLRASLQNMHVPADIAHLTDDFDTIVKKLAGHLKSYDLIILSGGVSKGKYDYLPEALEQVGVEKHFHRVAQRPGKPFWFGTHDTTTVFAFPGNPVSSFMCMQQYLRPWLQKSMRQEAGPDTFAVLSEDVSFKPDLTYFLSVRVRTSASGQWIAQPVKGHGSGDLANLLETNAFLVLPMGRDVYQKGEAYQVMWYN